MNTLFNILFVLSLIGMIIACGAGDAVHGCCGAPGTADGEEQEYFDKISSYVGIPSILCLVFLLFSHRYFGVTLLGLF